MSRKHINEKLVLSHGNTVDYTSTKPVNPKFLNKLTQGIVDLWEQNDIIGYKTLIDTLGPWDRDDAKLIYHIETRGIEEDDRYFVVQNADAWRVKNKITKKVFATSKVSLKKLLYTTMSKLGEDPDNIINNINYRHISGHINFMQS